MVLINQRDTFEVILLMMTSAAGVPQLEVPQFNLFETVLGPQEPYTYIVLDYVLISNI